jgi:ribonucleoside-diphosphate reductase alpha chain
LKATIDGVVYKIDKNRGLTKEVECKDYSVRWHEDKGTWNPNAEWAVSTYNITVDEHIKDLTGFCKWLDASCSKTINIPNKYSYNDFQNIYLKAYQSGVIKGVTTYRAGTMTSVLSDVNNASSEINNKIHKTTAPKRPKVLNCSVNHNIIKGIRYYTVVGVLHDEPYEVFTGLNHSSDGEIHIPKRMEKGIIIKEAKGKYILKESINSKEEYDLTNGHSDPTADALTRMISCSLRHGAEIHFVVDQLEKTKGDLISFAKVLARNLKKFIPEGTEVKGM